MLVAEREARGLKNVVISRLEQISPFPYDLVRVFFDDGPHYTPIHTFRR